jgi:hypothetical protein
LIARPKVKTYFSPVQFEPNRWQSQTIRLIDKGRRGAAALSDFLRPKGAS